MSNPSSSSITATAGSGRARSCIGCRQVKLACDARRTAPQPCSRCKGKGIVCKFDSNFRRIPMRRVAQEITAGYHNLLPNTSPAVSAMSPGVSSTALESLSTPNITLTTSSETSFSAINVPQYNHLNQLNQEWLSVIQKDYYVNYALDTLEVDAETAISLLRHFERHYLTHASFLARIESPYALMIKSPLLFWTIVMVAAREHDKYEGLYEQISVAHGLMLSQILQVTIQSVQDIHALLLLCLWPVPRVRQTNDPAWSYIGVAINAAMQLNCHSPLSRDHVASSWRGMTTQVWAEIGTELANLTWIHCFQIGVRLAAFQGLPPPLATTSQLQSITSAVSSLSVLLTEEQKAMTEILKLSSLSTTEVDYADDSQVRLSLIKMFDGQFDAIAQSYQGHWNLELDIELSSARLYLYALQLTTGHKDSSNIQVRQATRQVVLLRAKDTALRLISRMALLSNLTVEDGYYPAGALSFYPKNYFTSLHAAAVALFRFLASYQGTTSEYTETCVSGLTGAHKIFQSFPDHRDMVKAAINIQTLVDIVRNGDQANKYPLKELIITNRLGASIAFDAQFRVAHQRNRDAITGASPPVANWLGLDNDPRARLPMTPEQRAGSMSGGTGSNQGTDDGSAMMGPWTGWDSYMNDFEIGLDQWSTNEILSQMDLAAQPAYDPLSAAMMGQHSPYPGQ